MRLKGRSGVQAAIGALALVVAVSGCVSETEGDPSPSTVSASTGGAPSSRPTGIEPPERPAAMDNADEAGAVAAAEYFLRLTVYAAASGDTSELEAMSGEDCKGCKSYISSVNELYDQGGWWTSMPEVTIHQSQQWLVQDNPSRFQVELAVQKDSYEFHGGDGRAETAPAEKLIVAFIVTFSDSWTIDTVEASSSESFRESEEPR